jgi:hypothetical protein
VSDPTKLAVRIGDKPNSTVMLAPFPALGLSEPLQLALLPVTGYVLAFAYVAGYSRHFNIPLDFVTVDPSRILLGVVLTLGAAYLPAFNVLILRSVIRREHLRAAIRSRLARIGAVLAILYYLVHLYGWRMRYVGLAFGCLVFSVVLEFVLPLWTQRGKPYLKQLEAQDDVDSPENSGLFPIARFVGGSIFIVTLCLAVGGFLAYHAGRAKAVSQEWYYVSGEAPNVVLVGNYGTVSIGAEYIRDTKELSGVLMVAPSGTGLWTKMKWSRLGPLSEHEAK